MGSTTYEPSSPVRARHEVRSARSRDVSTTATAGGNGRAAGPASRALEALVLAVVKESKALAPNGFVERAGPTSPGPYRIDTGRLLGARPDADAIADIADRLRALVEIDEVVVRSPSVFVRPAAHFLHSVVLPGIGEPGADPAARGEPWIVCFSNPNANKPLHVGHLRICFIGMAMARMLEAEGHPVVRCQMISDYGIHIAQAVVAYRRWGGDDTPHSSGMKPDLFVGMLYARYHRELEASPDEAASLRAEAIEVLRAVEAGDEETVALSRRVTDWAVDGIDDTYRRIGTSHNSEFYESETLPVGRRLITEALDQGVFARRPDGSIVVDLSWVEVGTVTLVRNDATPLVFTQLLGSWLTRDRLYPRSRLLVVTGEQWKAGNDAMKEILHRCGYEHASEVTEPHYVGMVCTPDGTISSRRRNAATADDVLDQLTDFVESRCGIDFGSPMPRYLRNVAEQFAVALLKYSVLRITRGRPVVFDDARVTGDDYAKFRKIVTTLARLDRVLLDAPPAAAGPSAEATTVMVALDGLAGAVARARERRDPAELTRFLDLVCERVALWLDHAGAADTDLARAADAVIRRCFHLLDIQVPALLGALGSGAARA
jgi:arginyl-tRNA synthetase